jgi:hypothetical protein
LKLGEALATAANVLVGAVLNHGNPVRRARIAEHVAAESAVVLALEDRELFDTLETCEREWSSHMQNTGECSLTFRRERIGDPRHVENRSALGRARRGSFGSGLRHSLLVLLVRSRSGLVVAICGALGPPTTRHTSHTVRVDQRRLDLTEAEKQFKPIFLLIRSRY